MTTFKDQSQELQGISRTLLIPLYFRALENQHPNPLLKDKKAEEIINKLHGDFSWVNPRLLDQANTLIRARQFDRFTQDFLQRNMKPVVVDLGCGLDTRYFRLDDGKVIWYDLDLPEVIQIRRKLIDTSTRRKDIARSILDLDWMDEVKAPPNSQFLFLAEGVFPYFKENEVRSTIIAIRNRYSGSEIILDAMSKIMLGIHNLELRMTKLDARLQWGIDQDKEIEGWADGIKMKEAWFYFDKPEPRQELHRLMKYIPWLGKSVRILHYQLGDRAK